MDPVGMVERMGEKATNLHGLEGVAVGNDGGGRRGGVKSRSCGIVLVDCAVGVEEEIVKLEVVGWGKLS